MDREEIRYLLGSTIYARAKAYENRVQGMECETAENGVRHLSANVRGSGRNAPALPMKTAKAPAVSTSVRCC